MCATVQGLGLWGSHLGPRAAEHQVACGEGVRRAPLPISPGAGVHARLLALYRAQVLVRLDPCKRATAVAVAVAAGRFRLSVRCVERSRRHALSYDSHSTAARMCACTPA